MATSLNKIIRLLVALVEVGLVLRFVLKMLGASSTSPAIAWVYGFTAPLIQPFLAVLPTPAVVDGRFTIEFSTLFAIFAYAVIGYVLQELIGIVFKK